MLALSIALNGCGALAVSTWLWNSKLSLYGTSRLWDWRHAQVLAAFLWPLPNDGPSLDPGAKVAVATIHAQPYLTSGWSAPQGDIRWTVGRSARFEFNLSDRDVRELRMRLQPFLVRGRLDRQRLILFLNGKRLARLVLTNPTSVVKVLQIPPDQLQEHNVLELRLPDAAAPASFGLGSEVAAWGVAFWWLQVR